MYHSKQVLFSFFLVLIFSLCTKLDAQDLKGMYVNDFKYILGDSIEETKLLEFAEAQGFNYLLFYNLRYISDNLYDLTALEGANVLARFIKKAKEEYSVEAVGAVGQKFSSFNNIDIYNQFWPADDLRKIDVYHMEFEYWNKNFLAGEWESTDKDAAFEYYIDQLQQLKNVCLQRQVKCETYMGNVKPSECAAVGLVADRVIVHYYRKSDLYKNGNSIYQYKSYRLPALAPSGEKVLEVIPVFSARSYFMGPWLEEHPLEQAFETFLFGQNAYSSQEGDWKNNINIVGYNWYRYTNLEAILNNSPQAMLALLPEQDYPESLQKERENGSLYQMDQEANYLLTQTIKEEGPLLKVFPQPADKQLNIIPNEKLKTIQVFNALGKEIATLFVEGSSTEKIELSTINWKTGMYFMYITHRNNSTSVQKVLIHH